VSSPKRPERNSISAVAQAAGDSAVARCRPSHEDPAAVAIGDEIAVVVVGVTRGVERMDIQLADANRFPFRDRNIGPISSAQRRNRAPTAGAVTKRGRAGHMIGVDVRLDREAERKAETRELGKVALGGLQHRIDQGSLAAVRAADEIGVGRRLRFEQLPEQHRAPLA